MQWLPSPPTDNIYKLLAVFGLWLIAGALTLVSIFTYLDYRFQKETREESHHSQTEQMVNDFTKRIEALEKGTPELHKIADLPETFNTRRHLPKEQPRYTRKKTFYIQRTKER